MKQWELEDLITLMKAQKVLKVKMGQLEVELSPLALQITAEDILGQASVPLTGPEAMPTEEDFLYGSSPYLDILKFQRKQAELDAATQACPQCHQVGGCECRPS